MSDTLKSIQTRNENALSSDYMDIATHIVSAYFSKNRVPMSEVSGIIASVHAAIVSLDQIAAPAEPETKIPTATQVRRSITPDALISFIDGKRYKILKRHLAKHGMTIEDYRARYGLPRDYPSVAPHFSEMRSDIARRQQFGHKGIRARNEASIAAV